MKKFLSLALALVMTMSLVTISAGAKDFTDSSKITYSDAVDVMSTIKVVDGYTAGDFRPTNTLTRGAAAKIICNMILGPTTAGALPTSVAPFKDVPAGSTFAGYIAYCSQQKIINGYADGTFRPSGTLNGYAFMKMLLGALGYDGSVEGFTGANWSVNVAKLAVGIGLDDGLTEGFNGSKAVTREEACLYAFNTLQADMVEYSTTGSSITVGGVEIVTNPSKAEPVTTTSKSATIKDETADSDNKVYTVQFGERYFKDLEKDSNAYDDFGRPAAQWSYDDKEICVIADEADATYTKTVAEEDIYGDLNLKKSEEFKVYVDGKYQGDDKTVTIHDKDEDVAKSGNGVLVEVYKDDARIVVINTYIGEVDDVDTNKNDERIVTVDGKDFVTEEFEEDDMVLYTVGGKDSDKIQTMVPAEKLTGELTKISGSKYTIDGTVYEKSASVDEQVDAVSPKADVDFYLDSYGYLLKMEEADGEVAVDKLAYVEDSGNSRGTGWARLIMADGSAKTVDTTEKYATGAMNGKVVSFKVQDNGEYKLDEKKGANFVSDTGVSFEKGKTYMGNVKLDSKTVFVYMVADKAGDNADVEYKVYTGYKSAPSFTSATVKGYKAASKTAASVVFVSVVKDQLHSSSADLTFLASKDDLKVTYEEEMSYYEFQAVVDGKITTVKIDADVFDGTPALIDGAIILNQVSYDSDNLGDGGKTVAIGTNPTAADADSKDVFQATSSKKESNGVLTFDGYTLAYTDNVKVFFIDGDKITEGDIGDIREDGGDKDPYGNIYYTLDDGDVNLVVIEKN
ncbi:S-layer homology domain-containing protein [uncultured Oscillibacter sp.]|uniref:S-layer homology domain-containing protein n=1 Tax=uncultured Oscillibacter sp. TaxID=876091 RepID=UPI0025ED1740|nr:S-layer homology domain-containing protein [uncultured Oscillibacter sp.]